MKRRASLSLLCAAAALPNVLVAAVHPVSAASPPFAPPAASPAPADRVVILIAADRLLPADYERWAPDSLKQALLRADLGVISSRAASYEGDAGGFGSIGAGAGVAAPPIPIPTEPGEIPSYAAALQQSSREAHTAAVPGLLGQSVEDAGGYTAVVGSASGEGDWTGASRNDHAADPAMTSFLIAMDRAGRVSVDDWDRGSVPAPSWPYARRSVPHILVQSVEEILTARAGKPGLIVVDSGDASRADSWIWLNHATERQARLARAFWMPRVMEKLAALVLPLEQIAATHHAMLCLVTPVPPRRADGGPEPGLTPVAIWNPAWKTGALISGSTRRPGLILGLDLAPTFLEYLGIVPPLAMTGQPAVVARPAAGPMSVDRMRQIFALDARSRQDYLFERWGLIIYGILAGFAVLLASILPGRSLTGKRRDILQYFLLAGLAGPAALIIPLATPLPGAAGPAILAATLWLLFPLLLFRLRRPRQRLGGACALPALILMLDGISGGTIFRDALWGRMPIAGGRLYGIDNTCMGVLIGAAWVALGIAADWGLRRASAARSKVVPAESPPDLTSPKPSAEPFVRGGLLVSENISDDAEELNGPVSGSADAAADIETPAPAAPEEPAPRKARLGFQRPATVSWRRCVQVVSVLSLVLVALVIGLAPLGANVGGGITAAIGAGFFGALLVRRRGGWIGLLFGAALAIAILGISLGLDASRGAGQGSHLIHNWRQVLAAPGVALDIVVRKLWQNLSLTLWLLPGLIPVWLIGREIIRSRPILEARFARMPGLSAALRSLIPTMIAGYLVNDTGAITVVFIALYYFGALAFFRLLMVS